MSNSVLAGYDYPEIWTLIKADYPNNMDYLEKYFDGIKNYTWKCPIPGGWKFFKNLGDLQSYLKSVEVNGE